MPHRSGHAPSAAPSESVVVEEGQPRLSLEDLPAELLSAVFRYSLPKYGLPPLKRPDDAALIWNSSHEMWWSLAEHPDSLVGRQTLASLCLVSRRISRAATPILYRYLTPCSTDSFYANGPRKGNFTGIVRAGVARNERDYARFSHARTVALSLMSSHEAFAGIVGAAARTQLQRLHLNFRTGSGKLAIHLMDSLRDAASLRHLFIALLPLTSPVKREVTRRLRYLTQLDILSVEQTLAPLESHDASLPLLKLKEISFIDTTEAEIEYILAQTDTARMKCIFTIYPDREDIVEHNLDWVREHNFPELETLTIDGYYTMDLSPLRTLPKLKNLALGYENVEPQFSFDTWRAIPPSVRRIYLLSPHITALIMLTRVLKDLAPTLRTIEFEDEALAHNVDFYYGQLSTPDLENAYKAVGAMLTMAGVEVYPERLREFASTDVPPNTHSAQIAAGLQTLATALIMEEQGVPAME